MLVILRRAYYLAAVVSVSVFLATCSTTGVNPTGLSGGQAMCPMGPRPTLDCRGVLQQYARDFKADLNAMSKVDVKLGITSNKMMEADALTSDLLQHYYQTCSLYNACVLSPQQYAAKSEKLQEIQLRVRRAIVGGGVGSQQNIQINPGPGTTFTPSMGDAGMAQPPMDAPPPPPPPPGDGGGMMPPIAAVDNSGSGTSIDVNIPPVDNPQTRGDAVLSLLRQGSQLLRDQAAAQGTAPANSGAASSAPVTPPQGNLDDNLRGILQSLKKNVQSKNPAKAGGQVVVGNLTEEGQSWSSPLGALLRDRLDNLVQSGQIFRASGGPKTRGITVKQVAAVQNPNDPAALGTLYDADLSITGTYKAQSDRVSLNLSATDPGGTQLARARGDVPAAAVPNVVSDSAQNDAQTQQLHNALEGLGPKSQAGFKVDITTNQPGAGASFRLGDEIKYFVTSTMDGYLYLFHSDGEKNMTRIFPNQYQPEARISAGTTLEVPVAGAPFKFEASPPFGLETTFVVVTRTPLNEADFQRIEGGFAKPKGDVVALVGTRGVAIKATGAGAKTPTPERVWNSVTVLIRP